MKLRIGTKCSLLFSLSCLRKHSKFATFSFEDFLFRKQWKTLTLQMYEDWQKSSLKYQNVLEKLEIIFRKRRFREISKFLNVLRLCISGRHRAQLSENPSHIKLYCRLYL
jgi:hypothetical protein